MSAFIVQRNINFRTAGMPIGEMLRYAAIRKKCAGTDAERRALLERYRDAFVLEKRP